MTAAAHVTQIALSDAMIGVALAGPADGRPVLLGHALATDHRMWSPQIASLAAAGYRVIAPDFRGHGISRDATGPWSFTGVAADCAALAAALGIARFSYIGLSLGGVVGMELASRWPSLVEKLVLSNTRVRATPEIATACARRIATVEEKGMSGILAPTLDHWFAPSFLTKDSGAMAALFGEMMTQTAVPAYVALCEELGRLDLRQGLQRITCPTLVLGGALDRTTPPATVEEIAAHGADWRVSIIPGTAHFPNLEHPAAYDAVIAGFLAG